MDMQSAQDWAEAEFGDANLGDPRRVRRLIATAAGVLERPSGKVTGTFLSSAEREGVYRFLRSPFVATSEISKAHGEQTGTRCRDAETLIVAVDQTSLSLTDRVGKDGFGRVGCRDSKRLGGFQCMNALAIADGTVMGLLSQQWWTREERTPEWNEDNRPPKKRESDLFRRAVLESESRLDGQRAWYQMDRGADCAALLQVVAKEGLQVTIRSSYNRRIKGAKKKLHDVVRKSKRLGTHAALVKCPGSRRRQKVRLSIRLKSVTLKLRDTRNKDLCDVEMRCVHAKELGRPQGRKQIEWFLLTSAAAETLQEAVEVVNHYTARWRVEDFHKAWKSGLCGIEDSQLRSATTFQRWATIAAAVATRAEQLKTKSRALADANPLTMFTRHELRAILFLSKTKKFKHHDELNLAQAVELLASVGGYVGRTSSGGPPGTITIGRGLDRIASAAMVFESFDTSD